jgi:tRNA(Ile)-lysidine synthase
MAERQSRAGGTLAPFAPYLAQKNLLAFSGGIDSSALFFLLQEEGIAFDIALVNYGMRSQSDQEERFARELAERYGLEAHIRHAPRWESHFESQARRFRYDFFETLIDRHHYATLLTAHQLNDQLEWLLMRLGRGAGLSELIGLEPLAERRTGQGRPYHLLRPLLEQSKRELLAYLEAGGYPYFVDASNADTHYERNRIRKTFSDPLIDAQAEGIRRSFAYLRRDKAALGRGIELLFEQEELRVYRLASPELRVRAADRALKELGYLLSSAQRREIEKNESLVVGGRWAVVSQGERLYLAPYRNAVMSKVFRERCRRLKIPAKIRPYCYEQGIEPEVVMRWETKSK